MVLRSVTQPITCRSIEPISEHAIAIICSHVVLALLNYLRIEALIARYYPLLVEIINFFRLVRVSGHVRRFVRVAASVQNRWRPGITNSNLSMPAAQPLLIVSNAEDVIDWN